MPALMAPSPITHTTLLAPPAKSRATAMARATPQARRRRNRGGGVRGAESVVLALDPLGEAREPPTLAQGANAVATTGEDLVRIGLMADVPNQSVAWRVENPVQGHG